MTQPLKYSIFKILALAFTIFLSAFVYKKIYWIPEIKDQGPMLYNLQEYQWHNDLLYFGESSNYWVSPEDTDKRTISDMINDSIPGMRMSGLQVPAYHAGMFLPVIRMIDTSSRVRSLVITMNLRSFGQPWIYSTQENALMRARCFYNDMHPLYNRLAASLQYYHNPTADKQDRRMLHAFEYDTLKVDFPLPYNTIKTWCEQEKFPLPGGGEDFPKRVLADHYIKGYAFQIDTNTNVRIKDFDEIVKVCRDKKLRLYFNILSENVSWADSLVGEELVYFMRSNRDLLVERYTRMGAIVIDNLETVPGENFGEKTWTTEHYDQYGRMLVAGKVANVILKHEP